MNKILKYSIICFVLLLCPSFVYAAEGNDKIVITGFEYQEPILDNLYFTYEQKPDKTGLIESMPHQMKVYLEDNPNAVAVDVGWFDISGDYDSSQAYYYQFSPVWDEEKYVLDPEIDLYTEVPYIAVFLQRETGSVSRAVSKYANETAVYEFLRDNFNFNAAAISGILANLQKESCFRQDEYNGNDTGGTISYGLCQWNSGGGRYYTLKSWCASNGYDYTTLEGQLRFMEHELRTSSYYRLSQLENDIPNTADGAYEASMLWSKYYEGCSKRYYEERANLAKNTYWPVYSKTMEDESKYHPVFKDVLKTDWYYDAIDYMYHKGIMTGMTKNTFGAVDKLSRAQFVVALHRTVGSPSVAYETRFKDVPNGTWYTDAIMWSSKGYVVTGYENGCFGPADLITREQIAVMLYRYAAGMSYDISASADLTKYVDYAAVSPFAQDAMEWAVGAGIITGTDGGTRLRPQAYASRAECATMIMRMLKH